MGGRVADIAIDPLDSSTWYIAVGSGGIWKTENAGISWRPMFDDQPSYSIGCITVDPADSNILWVGTGENVSGRHVGWGDGVYKSLDAGNTWTQMGLISSEHIGVIVVDPRDSDIVYVAAEGPLWKSGGERGLFRTTDGGRNWSAILVIDDDTGVTDVEIDPRDPDVIYAATYQRRRHIWSLMAGGPGSGIHKSTDGGENWRRLELGLPKGDMGKIGLAVSPVEPNVIYATIEAEKDERGFYRSLDRGETWERRNPYISGGTGPHYYQEIVPSPHDVDHVYQMDVFIHVTRDGGATFEVLGNGREKHSDNHALVIDLEDPEHLLAGTDASLYESFDDGQTWRQFPNLPVAQFYKLALDTSEPFYNIVGGAQDLGTLLGPSRTTNIEGVRNQDWYVPLGADGYDSAFDPVEPNLVYMQTQGGQLRRYDRDSHELIDIQPMPAPEDPPERFNWDAPILVSPHSNTRLYFGSQRLWRSDDRGNSWIPVSKDLTRNLNRYELDLMGRVWSIDALHDTAAMSLYGTITTISESPLVEGLLYLGTDDGLIQVSEDGGDNWRAIEIAGVPSLSFVNDIQASLHDADSVFVVVDSHKSGVFKPFVFESMDRGRSWQSIVGNLPGNEIIWALEQDHVKAELLFVGAEFGLYFSPDGGSQWIKLSEDVPTIAFRDIELQRRDNDVVGATFGRGFYILDDYTPLREIAQGVLANDAHLFSIRDAWLYVPSLPMQARGKPSLGSDDFTASNPPFGAVITYYLREQKQTSKAFRHERESEQWDRGESVTFPGYERLAAEALEHDPILLLTISDSAGKVVRRIKGSAESGIHRVNWDLRMPPPDPVSLEVQPFQYVSSTFNFTPPWVTPSQGPLVPPGHYKVEMALVSASGVMLLGKSQEFEVKFLPTGVFSVPDYVAVSAFQERTAEFLRRAHGARSEIQRAGDRLRDMRYALGEAPRSELTLYGSLEQLERTLASLKRELLGDPIREHLNEASSPSILRRLQRIAAGQWDTRQAPTMTQQKSLEIAESSFRVLSKELSIFLDNDLPNIETKLEKAGAPWTPGRKVLPY